MGKKFTRVREELFAGDGEMAALMRGLDWSKTPLGPVESWPQSLKTSVSICLNSRFAILVWWGPKLVKIYNDAYRPLIGSKHPKALGCPGREVWPEIWDIIGPMLSGVMERGEASWSDDLLLLLERHGYPEECYFTFSYSPIRDESGGVGGVFTPVAETTDTVIGERRLRTLHDLAAISGGGPKSRQEVCEAAVKIFADNPHDLPAAAIYLCGEHRTRATLAAQAGSLTSFPEHIELQSDLGQHLAGICHGETCVVEMRALNIKPSSEPWGEPPVHAIAVPILPPHTDQPVGFLLAGISVRKRLDEPYRSFYFQATKHLADSMWEAEILERERALWSEAELERSRMRELFMHAPAGIAILTGPEHRFTLANERYLEMVGRKSAADLIDKAVLESLPEVAGQGVVEILNEVFETGIPFVANELRIQLDRLPAAQSAEAYFDFVYQPMLDVEGRTREIFVLAIESTERVLARGEMEMHEEQFRVLADSIPQLAWMSNPDGYIVWYNRRWYEYTGTTLEQMEGWGWRSVHDPQLLPGVVARYKRSIDTGELFDMTFPLRGADGKFRSFLTRALPVRDASGKIVRWFGTNTDVDAQQRTEAALRQSEKLAAVGRLASSIAHEINNPLEAVTNLIYLARSFAANQDVQGYLQSAQQELQRVSQIANQTLRFHKQQTAPSKTDVGELLDSILTLYRGKLSRDGVRLEIEAEECPPFVCYAGEIRQVLANLVGNALDAMPKGGTLRVRLRPATDWRGMVPGIRITVADTGLGMPPEVRKRIYEPFFTTKGETGTGLGLWISAGIIDKHGGSLHVRSSARPAKSWTAFTLILPLDGAISAIERPRD